VKTILCKKKFKIFEQQKNKKMASKNSQQQQVAKSSKDAQKQFFGNHQFVDDETYYKFDNDKFTEFMSARPWAKEYVCLFY